jgi:hypothetical protein
MDRRPHLDQKTEVIIARSDVERDDLRHFGLQVVPAISAMLLYGARLPE